MGCIGSSQDKDLKLRLDATEKTVQASPTADGDGGLDEMGKCAQEIRYVMQILIARGAKDSQSIRRIEFMSDAILGNLLSRLSPEELRKGSSSYKPLVESIMKVATDLDAVRATKATDAVINHVAAAESQKEKRLSMVADPIVMQLNAEREKLKNPAHLVPGSKTILDLVEKSHCAAPDSKKVTGELLDAIVSLSVWILKNEKCWAVDYASCQAVIDIAGRVDSLATKLVVIMEAVWDPPMLPQVEHVQKSAADVACTSLLKAAETQLANSNTGGAYDSLAALLPWWPLLKETGAHTLEVVGMFSKMQTFANDSFTKATSSGDTATAEAIRGFADQFDELRKTFEGLPPTAEGSGTLGETLGFAEAKGAVIKALGTLDGEVAKTTDDDKSTNLSLAATVQAMEALVANWSKARTGDEELAEQLDASCSALEDWTEKIAANLPGPRIEGILKFAEEYDSRRGKLVPPEAKKGALRPRIASLAAAAHLKVVDAELAKTEGLKPNTLLDALKLAAEAIPGDDGTEEIRCQLLKAFTAVDERLLQSFVETVAASEANEKKEVMLMKFAAMADEIRAQCSLASGELGAASLVQRLEEKRSGMAGDLVAKVVAESDALKPGSGAGPDFASVLEVLCSIESTCSKAPLNEELQARLGGAFKMLGPKLVEACGKAAADESLKACDEFFRLARGMDGAVATLALGILDKPPSFQTSIAGTVASLHLAAAEKALVGEDPPYCAVLIKELAAMENMCLKEHPAEDLSKKICKFTGDLEKPLTDKMMRTPPAAAKSLIEAAAAADQARAAAEGSDPSGDLSAKVLGVQAVAGKVAEAKTELEKPSGMNPIDIVKTLRELESLWEPVKNLESCCASLVEVAGLFNTKLEEACGKALASEDEMREKKVQAVVALAQETDKALEPLAALSADGIKLSKAQAAVARVVAEHYLVSLDAELAKETGRNPAVMLSCSQELAKVWPDVPGTCDTAPAESNTATADTASSVAGLVARWKETHAKVKTRMQEAMEDALKTANEKKKQALLKFASDFDEACGSFSEGLLAEELRAKMES